MNIARSDAQVAIIGLGPTGLMLAHLLGRRSLKVVVLERDHKFYGRARAVYTDDECFRVFQMAGIAEDLAADMIHDSAAQWLLPDGRVLAQYRQNERPNHWPVMNFLYQPWLETKMEARLAGYDNVKIRRGRNVTGFVEDRTGVTVTHEPTDGGDAQQLRADWLIACDGGRSATRKALDIRMRGESYPERWLVVDLKVDDADETLRHLPYFSFVCDPEQPVVCCPQPGGHHRFEFLLRRDQDAAEMERPEKIRSLLSRFIDPERAEILRSLVYTFNALNAETWRKGRVILAGDAAHMTPQFMGQGMSAGLRDAGNLAWKLDLVARGKADAALLDTFEAERRPHAQAMIFVSVQMMRFVSVSRPMLAACRNAVIKLSLMTPGLSGWLRNAGFKPKPVISVANWAGLSRSGFNRAAGRLIPQPQLRNNRGRLAPLDDHLGKDFALVGFGCDPFAQLTPEARSRWKSLGARSLTVWPAGERPQSIRSIAAKHADTVELEDPRNSLVKWLRRYGAPKGSVVVVRPDRFVAASVRVADLEIASSELFRRLSLTGASYDA